MTSTAPFLRKNSLPVFEPAPSTTWRAGCVITGRPASLLSRAAASGTSSSMLASFFSCRADVAFIISAQPIFDPARQPISTITLGNDRCPAATVSIEDDAVVDDLRLRQTLCILHHMQGIRADRCCRINAPVGCLGPCSDANQDQSRYENADLTHLNSPVDLDSP